jgi:hypothetical protein
LITAIVGGILALVTAVRYGYLRTAVTNIYALMMHWRVSGVRPMDEVTLTGSRGPRLAYAVPIAAGTLVTLWLK